MEYRIDSLPGSQAEGLASAGRGLHPLSDRSDEEERDHGRTHRGGIEEEDLGAPALQERRFVDVGNHQRAFARLTVLQWRALLNFGNGILRRSFIETASRRVARLSNPSGFSERIS